MNADQPYAKTDKDFMGRVTAVDPRDGRRMAFEVDNVLIDLGPNRGPEFGPEGLRKQVCVAEWTAVAIARWSFALCPL